MRRIKTSLKKILEISVEEMRMIALKKSKSKVYIFDALVTTCLLITIEKKTGDLLTLGYLRLRVK